LAREESCKKRLEIQEYCLTGSKTYITYIFREKQTALKKPAPAIVASWGNHGRILPLPIMHDVSWGKKRVVRKWSTPKYPKISWFIIIFPIQLSRLGYPMVFSPPSSTKIIVVIFQCVAIRQGSTIEHLHFITIYHYFSGTLWDSTKFHLFEVTK
jgi:hypothetical protein